MPLPARGDPSGNGLSRPFGLEEGTMTLAQLEKRVESLEKSVAELQKKIMHIRVMDHRPESIEHDLVLLRDVAAQHGVLQARGRA